MKNVPVELIVFEAIPKRATVPWLLSKVMLYFVNVSEASSAAIAQTDQVFLIYLPRSTKRSAMERHCCRSMISTTVIFGLVEHDRKPPKCIAQNDTVRKVGG